LLKIFKKHQRDGRVILPLLKTLDLLITHRMMENTIQLNPNFGVLLVNLIMTEERKSSDVQQLFAFARVLFGLLGDSTNREVSIWLFSA